MRRGRAYATKARARTRPDRLACDPDCQLAPMSAPLAVANTAVRRVSSPHRELLHVTAQSGATHLWRQNGQPVVETLYGNVAGGRPYPLRDVPSTPPGEDSQWAPYTGHPFPPAAVWHRSAGSVRHARRCWSTGRAGDNGG